MSVQALIRRELVARREFIVGTVMTQRTIKAWNVGGTAPVWVCDVDIGRAGIVRNVLIKSGSDGTRRYADLGQTVLLRRNALGRWQIVGPGDRVTGTLVRTEYDFVTGGSVGATNQGFTVRTQPLEYLMGASAMKGAPLVTFSAAGGTITRSDGGAGAGSWIVDGFAIGWSVTVTGSRLNDGVYTVTGVSALVLTLSAPGFTDEATTRGVGIGRTGTARWNDTITPLRTVQIIDANGNVLPPSA